ncbi:MAG: AAA family ATPase [Nanoarchaeota archaeon]|nr:AAA family ATPase [Nanoarchaeota archaeon]
MDSYTPHVAAANEYVKIAREQEATKNYNQAAINYIRAAQELLKATKLCKDETAINAFQNQIEICKAKAQALSAPKKTAIREGDDKEDVVKSFEVEIPDLTFDKVAGMQEVKDRFYNAIILPLENPDLFFKFVKKDYMASGIILYGPPGCGKTYIAKAAAGEASKRLGKKVTFLYIDASSVLSSYVGVSEKNLKRVFEEAAEKEPAIIVFDEIDGIGMSRSGNRSSYAQRLVNQFLSSFDIITGKSVLVVGTTNKVWGIDSALLRSGRFGYHIRVDPLDFEARKELFKLSLDGLLVSNDINYDELARMTQYYASSDITAICAEAGRRALKEHIKDPSRKLCHADLVEVIKDTRSSLYRWVDEYKRHKDKVSEEFKDLEELVNKIDEHRKQVS